MLRAVILPDGAPLKATLHHGVGVVSREQNRMTAARKHAYVQLLAKMQNSDMISFIQLIATRTPKMNKLLETAMECQDADTAPVKATVTRTAGPTTPTPGRRKSSAPQFNA